VPRPRVIVDVTDFVAGKRDALLAHQTQFPPDSTVPQLPLAVFQTVFGTEWFIGLGRPEPSRRSWILDS